jgi:hypothetical protein
MTDDESRLLELLAGSADGCTAMERSLSLFAIVIRLYLLLLLYVRLSGFGRRTRNYLTCLRGIGLLHQIRRPI